MKYEKIDKIIGNKIYEARVIKRITQEDMAENVSRILKANGYTSGITRAGYSHYEVGRRSMPLMVLQACCEYLKLDWQKLFNEALEEMKIK